MKRQLVLLIMSFAALSSVQAQKVQFGIKAGVNISALGDYDFVLSHEDAGLENKPGLYAGLFIQIPFTSNFGMETGLFYAQLGGKDKENDYAEQYKITANASYLQLPVSLFYKFRLPAGISLYPSVGLYAGYGLGGKIKTRGTIGETDLNSDTGYFDDFARRFDFGGTFGVNLEFRKIVLGTSYDRSFIRVNKEDVLYGDNAFNSIFRISLGYMF